jgi:hypothetical protein
MKKKDRKKEREKELRRQAGSQLHQPAPAGSPPTTSHTLSPVQV